VETFIEEMKRYLGFTEGDAALLQMLGPRLEKYLPEMAERFYSQIPFHSNAFRVFTGGEAQISRLKQTLQRWAGGLFSGVYDQAYAEERFQIGYRHVRIGLEQKYVISAMGIVRSFFNDCLLQEVPQMEERLPLAGALGKILDIDLNLMCESYMRATVQNLRSLNEQMERANRQLAEAGHSKDQFLAHISHELRTPLNSILGFSKLILDGLCPNPEEERQLLRDVFASAQHLLGLVNDILDIGRIEAGKLSLQSDEVSLRAILDSTLPLVAIQAAERNLSLIDATAGVALPVVRADEVRLRQVLLNLLSNAVKFTNFGSVTVRALPNEEPEGESGAASPPLIRVEVEDTGIGVPPEKRESVFQKFFQADPSYSRRLGGTGLGLAISRSLVELMGGTIGLQDGKDGRGTLVWFTVPLASHKPSQNPIAITQSAQRRTVRAEQ
jgi:signal transduction histidine kinase